MTAATVIIPTHDHGPLLARAARSALTQTVGDIELLIIGDGATAATRDVADSLLDDPRVRFLDFPKSPRTGEPYRHAALQEARGEVVAYLGDDDLWLPMHLAEMQRLLESADFVHAQPVRVMADGTLDALGVDLAIEEHREALLTGHNAVPLACAAHTLDFYRRLPHGWRTAPAGVATDLYMWQQVLAQPGARLAAAARPTVLVFPSPWRQHWPMERRVAELDLWAARLAEPGLREELADVITRQLIAGHGRQLQELRATLAERDETIRELQAELHGKVGEANGVIADLRADVAERDESVRELQGQVAEQSDWARRMAGDVSLRDATIRELQAEMVEVVAVRDREIMRLQQMLDEVVCVRDEEIARLQRSLPEAGAPAEAFVSEEPTRATDRSPR